MTHNGGASVIFAKGTYDLALVANGSLACESSDRVQMANRNRQSIGGVEGLWRGGKIEQARDHMLDLLFFGPSVANDCGFDCQRGVFRDFQPGRRCG